MAESAANLYYKNMFRGTLESTTIQTTDGGFTNYYLSSGDYGVGFYRVTKEDGVSMGANRSYLPIPSRATSNARGESVAHASGWGSMVISDEGDDVIGIPVYGSIGGDGEDTTGINAMTADDRQAVYYNLHGQRIENPTKGLYIKNGRKVVVR